MKKISQPSKSSLAKNKTKSKWKPAHLAWADKTSDTIIAHYGIGKQGSSQLCPTSFPMLSPRRFSPRELA
eukprot:Pgem_evm1s16301